MPEVSTWRSTHVVRNHEPPSYEGLYIDKNYIRQGYTPLNDTSPKFRRQCVERDVYNGQHVVFVAPWSCWKSRNNPQENLTLQIGVFRFRVSMDQNIPYGQQLRNTTVSGAILQPYFSDADRVDKFLESTQNVCDSGTEHTKQGNPLFVSGFVHQIGNWTILQLRYQNKGGCSRFFSVTQQVHRQVPSQVFQRKRVSF